MEVLGAVIFAVDEYFEETGETISQLCWALFGVGINCALGDAILDHNARL